MSAPAGPRDRRGRVAYSDPRNERDRAVILFAGTLAQRRAEPGSPLGRSDARAAAACLALFAIILAIGLVVSAAFSAEPVQQQLDHSQDARQLLVLT